MPPSPTTILVVNDDDVGRRITAEVLRGEFAVIEASTGAEALRLSLDGPDLVVLDVKLPDVSGFEVCRQIKARPETALTPVLHLSAVHLDWRSKVAGLEGGADAYLTEPIEPPVLLAVVRALLRARRAEQEVLAAAQQWQSTFDAIEDGIALLDGDGRLTRCNDALARMLQASPEAIAGARWDELFEPGPTASDEPGVWERARRSRQREAMEIALGDRRAQCAVHPVMGEQEDVTSGLAIVVDVTERRNLEEQLQTTQKLEAIGRLSGGIAHELNNVLTVIQSNGQLIHDASAEDDARRGEATEVLRAAERGARLIQQLLLFSQRQRAATEVVDLNDTLLGLDPMLRRMAGARIELVSLPGAGLWPVRANAHHLETVITNLVVNACDAMPEGGKLILGTSNVTGNVDGPWQEDHVLFTVEDNGTGMTDEVKAHLFEPFFTTKAAGEGTGLGLAVVHGIVTRAGGAIEVRSEPWKGSRFEVRLPRAPGEARVSRRPISDVPPRGTGTVLLVEDEPLVRKVIGRTLRSHGYTVLEAEHGEHALHVALDHAGEIQLCLTDVVMPHMSGRELARELAILRPATKILFMSGYTASEFEDSGPAERSPASGQGPQSTELPRAFLQKPFTPSVLLRKIRDVLDGR